MTSLPFRPITLTASAIIAATMLHNPYPLLVAIFFAPVCYYALRGKLSFASMFWWGTVFYTIHGFAIWDWLTRELAGGLTMSIAVIAYGALIASTWFSISHYLINIKLKPHNLYPLYKLASWTISMYSYFMMRGWLFAQILSPGGYYFLDSPLIGLCNTTWGQQLLITIPFPILLLFFVITNMLIAAFFCCKRIAYAAYFLVLVSALFMLGRVNKNKVHIEQIPGHISPLVLGSGSMHDRVAKLKDAILRSSESYCFLMPESTFTETLNHYPEIGDWLGAALGKRELYMGAHAADGTKRYNCIYRANASGMQPYYVKQQLVQGVEAGLPARLSGQRRFSTSTQQDTFMDGYKPAICADYFLCEPWVDRDMQLIIFANDDWRYGYYRDLMRLGAILRCLITSRSTRYVGHHYAVQIELSNKNALSLR